MTTDERDKILNQIEELIGQLREDNHDIYDGKVVWPPNEEMSHKDALATLFDIETCDLDLTLYMEDKVADEWLINFSGTESYPNSPGHYACKPLKAMIEEQLSLYASEKNLDSQPARTLQRLLLAFEEPLNS